MIPMLMMPIRVDEDFARGFGLPVRAAQVVELYVFQVVDQRALDLVEQAVVEVEALADQRALQPLQGVVEHVVLHHDGMRVRRREHFQAIQAGQQGARLFRLVGRHGVEADVASLDGVVALHGFP